MEFNRREAQRQAIVRLNTFVNTERFQQTDLIAVEDRLRLLENSYERINEEHLTLLEANVQPDDLDAQHELATAVEDLFLETYGRLRARITALTASQNPQVEVNHEVANRANERNEFNGS